MSQEDEQVLTINFKILGQPNIETLELPVSATGETLKTLISDFSDIPISEMRLIYKGRAIGNTDTLSAFDIPDGATINVVKMRKPVQQTQQTPSPAPAPAPAPGPDPTPNATQGQPQQPTGPIPRVRIHRTERRRQVNNEPHDRVDEEEVKEMRKKASSLQLKTAKINSEIQKLMSSLTVNRPEKITESINAVKAIIESSMPEMQEIANSISFSTVHPAEAPRAPSPAQATEEYSEESNNSQTTQPAPDPDVDQIPKPAEPKPEGPVNPTPDPTADPDIESVPPPTPAPTPAPAPAPAPAPTPTPAPQPPNPLAGLGGMLSSLFQQPQRQQAPTAPQVSVFTPEDLALMDADAAKVETEGYVKQLHETYRCTNLYRKMK